MPTYSKDRKPNTTKEGMREGKRETDGGGKKMRIKYL